MEDPRPPAAMWPRIVASARATCLTASVAALVCPVLTAQTPPSRPAAAAKQRSREPLNHTRWAIEVLPATHVPGQPRRGFADTLVFSRDELRSLYFQYLGFTKTRYVTTRKRDHLRIRAEQRSPKEGHLVWTARASLGPGRIAGTLVWTRNDRTRTVHTFVGTRGTPLEGTIWSVRATAASGDGEKEEPRRETLAFRRGRLVVSTAVRLGFLPATYTLERKGKVWHVRSTVRSPEHGVQEWDLRIEGDQIRGKLAWQREETLELRRINGRRIAPKD